MLTPKQEEFCYKYIANNYNAAAAYREVFECAKNTAYTGSANLLKQSEIKAKVAEIRKAKLDELQIDADRVTEKLAEIAFSKRGDEYYNSTAQLKALELLSKTLGMQVQKVETKAEIIEVGIQ